jgi:hypothetical protein
MIDYDEMMDEIILNSLKESYKMVGECSGFNRDIKMSKALKRVIKFYSTPTQYKEWKEGNEPN